LQLSLELFFTILNHLLVFITIFFWIFARFLNGYVAVINKINARKENKPSTLNISISGGSVLDTLNA